MRFLQTEKRTLISSEQCWKKIPLSFYYTSWFIGIPGFPYWMIITLLILMALGQFHLFHQVADFRKRSIDSHSTCLGTTAPDSWNKPSPFWFPKRCLKLLKNCSDLVHGPCFGGQLGIVHLTLSSQWKSKHGTCGKC